MAMVMGYILIALGASGTFYFWSYIENDYWYTYTAPFTSHETTMLTLLFLSFALLIGGVVTIIVSVLKSKNTGKLNQIQNFKKGLPKNVCPSCGLNVTDSCSACPACGYRFEKEGVK